MAKVKLSPPWDIFYREINAMFMRDPEVRVMYDEEALTLKLYVSNDDKADALMQVLPPQKTFGNVTLQIEVVPANDIVNGSAAHLWTRVFFGNDAVNYIREVKGIAGLPDVVFVLFRKEVVQYYTDNLSDFHGLTSTLYQNIAKDIFVETENVYFCTDIDYGQPLADSPAFMNTRPTTYSDCYRGMN